MRDMQKYYNMFEQRFHRFDTYSEIHYQEEFILRLIYQAINEFY